MKHFKIFVAAVALFGNTAILNAQAPIDCSWFCVIDIGIDTVGANTLNVTIHMEGVSTDFINYPYVSVLTDVSGDTVATGDMYYFGQMGGTSQAYPMSTTLDSLSLDLIYDMEFVYESGADTCQLTSPCGITHIEDPEDFNSFNLFPNPSNGIVVFRNENIKENCEVKVYNSRLETIYSDTFSEGFTQLDLSTHSKGIYFVAINSGSETHFHKLILE